MNAIVLENFSLFPDDSATCTETIPEPCDKCQHSSCFALHDYSPSNCPFQTCNECIELEKLDAQISDAQNLLISLSKKRNGLKERINRRHDRFTSRLPVEVISYIFLFAAGSNPVQYTKKKHSLLWNPTLLLGAVCRRWRDITLRLPQLWTSLFCNPYKHSSSPDITEKWLSRSGVLPLYLKVTGNRLISDPSTAYVITPAQRTFIELLRFHSGRWKELALQVPAYIVHGIFNDLDDVHNLKDLTLLTVGDGRNMEPVTMKNPMVPESLCAKSFALGDFSVEWDKLTQFAVEYLSVDEVVHVFLHARNLHSAFVHHVMNDAGHYPLPAAPVINLSTKELDNFGWDLLRHLTLPSLEILKYRLSTFSDPMVGMNILADFITRSQPALVHFLIYYCVDLPEWSDDWYTMFPSLTQLELDLDFLQPNMDRVQGYIDGLDASLDPLAFPRLQALRLVVDGMCAESWRRLVRIFPDNSEDNGNIHTVKRPLTSVTVRFRRCPWRDSEQDIEIMDDDTRSRLTAIQESGVILKVFDADGVDLMGSDTSSESDDTDDSDEST